MTSHTATICLGSNFGAREANIASAVKKLSEIAVISEQSALSESDDITGRGEPYLNMVAVCDTRLSFAEFSRKIYEIECAGGRQHGQYDRVSIDIDIVIWDDEIVSEADFNRPYFSTLYQSLILKETSLNKQF